MSKIKRKLIWTKIKTSKREKWNYIHGIKIIKQI